MHKYRSGTNFQNVLYVRYTSDKRQYFQTVLTEWFSNCHKSLENLQWYKWDFRFPISTDKNSNRYCSVHKFSSISTAEMVLVSSSSGVQNDCALSKLIRPLGHSMSSQQTDVALLLQNYWRLSVLIHDFLWSSAQALSFPGISISHILSPFRKCAQNESFTHAVSVKSLWQYLWSLWLDSHYSTLKL
jgi:hypothetical protein